MRRAGPYLTLIAGLVLAGTLTGLSVAASQDNDSPAAVSPPVVETPSPSAPAEPPPESPPPSPPPSAKPPQGETTYAGRVAGGGSVLAIVIRNGKAIAYLCDGKRTEAWLQGTADGGTLTMSGAKGASLTGTYANGVASGNVTAGGRQWTFSVGVVKPPSGLYRASARVRSATIVAGWVCYPGGGCVGTYTSDNGEPAPGPALDTTTGRFTLDGETLRAMPATPEGT